MNNRTVTLLTDFGLQDIYVGVIKGAIAQINPSVQIIDLSHQIPPQNIAAGRFCLLNAYSYFPPETVHIAVVDPGVGSQRRGIAVAFAEGFLVGPDNGLFSGVLNLSPAIAAVELAKLPVLAQETVENPSSLARVKATDTTLSLKLRVGILTASFLI